MWLFLVRHGAPDYKNDCLNEYGKKQAQALANRFALQGLDKIYASTMGRATETAGFTAQKLGLNVEGVDFAREDYAGEEFAVTMENGKRGWCFWSKKILNDFNSEEVKKLGDKWYDSPLFANTKFKSGTLRVKKAVIEFMENLGYRFNEKTGAYDAVKHVYDRVALFAHGGFSMIFTSSLLNIPYPLLCTRFKYLGKSTVTAFCIDDEGEGLLPQVMTYANDSHLYKDDLLEGFDWRAF